MKIIFILYFLIFPNVQAWEWCKFQAKICPPGTEHIMCKPKVPYEDNVVMTAYKFHSVMPSTRVVKKYLLSILNVWRDAVASGVVDKFPKAARMRELVWDYELEFLAKEHNKGLVSVKDKCRATKRFPKAGQFTGTYAYADIVSKSLHYVNQSMQSMWTQKASIEDPVAWATNFTKPMKGRHFAQLMNDRVSRVGCSVTTGLNCSTTPDGPPAHRHCTLLTCNFDYTWIYYKEIYTTHPSTPGAGCSYWGGAGYSKTYPNLCENDGSLYLDRIKE